MTCCPHPAWMHATVIYPQYRRPCQALTCCGQPAKYHDGPGHTPTYCHCDDWNNQA